MMKHAIFLPLGCAMGVGLVAVLATCARPPKMPAIDGAVIEIRRSDRALTAGERGHSEQLQLYWFGSACHLVRLGEVSVLTDPFVTNNLQAFDLASDPARVAATLGRIAPPDAVVVNHSHHDHLLDAFPALSLPRWRARGTSLFGGHSAINLLAGYDGGRIDPRWHAVEHGSRIRIPGTPHGYSVTITAYQTKHAAHLKCGYTFANRRIPRPRTSPPRNLTDFQAGEVFNYLIELRAPGGVEFNVFYLGAPYHLDELPESQPPPGTSIDVAIILAPSADNVRHYPQEHLARLQPKHIVLSHFNSFIKENSDDQLAFGPLDFVQFPHLSREVQRTFALNEAGYPTFETFHIPAITRIEPNGEARNVIRIP